MSRRFMAVYVPSVSWPRLVASFVGRCRRCRRSFSATARLRLSLNTPRILVLDSAVLQLLSTAECDSCKSLPLSFAIASHGRTRRQRGPQTPTTWGWESRRTRDGDSAPHTKLPAPQPPPPGSARRRARSLWGWISEALPRRGREAAVGPPTSVQDLWVRLLQGQLKFLDRGTIISKVTCSSNIWLSGKFCSRSSTKLTGPRRAIPASTARRTTDSFWGETSLWGRPAWRMRRRSRSSAEQTTRSTRRIRL